MANIGFIKEIWEKNKDYPNYEISNLGNVRNHKTGRVLKSFITKDGYVLVAFSKNNKIKSFLVHRLVMNSFIKNHDNLKDINHINGDKIDNRVVNLEWVSERENCCHRFINKNTSSKYVGVSFCKQTQKWRSNIFIDGKVKSLGRFKNEAEAYQSRIDFENNNNIINRYL